MNGLKNVRQFSTSLKTLRILFHFSLPSCRLGVDDARERLIRQGGVASRCSQEARNRRAAAEQG